MGFFKLSLGEDKGVECDISNQDGIVTAVCKRTNKQKDGSSTFDGQTVTVFADPSNDCQPSYTGHLAAMDDDGFKAFDPLAKRLTRSCRRMSKTGLVPSAPKKE